MSSLELIIKKFLKKEGYLDQPLLLALSGGPDSMSLFHILLQIRVDFEVAHVDHGWRVTSKTEAQELKKMCEKVHIPFHTIALHMDSTEKNLEDRCREKRFEFFQYVVTSRGLQAVLCAHHADDQAETVLKRALEGSPLTKLSALQSKKRMRNFIILRPLLTVTKKQILDWLEERGITYFIDKTNSEERFLRGRMRSEIIPALTQVFGKNVQKGLCRLAQHAREFNEYLNSSLNSFDVIEVQSGYQIILSKEIIGAPFLCKMTLRRFFTQYKISVSNELLDIFVKYFQNPKGVRKEKIRGRTITLEKNRVQIDFESRSHNLREVGRS